jgi:hypothetical protein
MDPEGLIQEKQGIRPMSTLDIIYTVVYMHAFGGNREPYRYVLHIPMYLEAT